jgi:hypothetical protein
MSKDCLSQTIVKEDECFQMSSIVGKMCTWVEIIELIRIPWFNLHVILLSFAKTIALIRANVALIEITGSFPNPSNLLCLIFHYFALWGSLIIT